MIATQPFAKTLCSICYEDLKPIVEDLQAISICGHVFHELCLQQWFEYCSNGKKKCPICKQTCSAANVSRLYFESVGDLSDCNLSQKLQSHKEDTEELKLEVRRLKGKISELKEAIASREKQLNKFNDEFFVCKELLKKEKSLKEDAMKKKNDISTLLYSKTQELEKSKLKRRDLEDENKKLAKEHDALELVSDLDLKDDKIVKLASSGTESHSKASVDTLTKLLVDRNKLYKELSAKYQILERDEACSRKELEKANEKLKELKRLKEKVKKMETPKEMKDSPRFLNDTCTPQDKIEEPDVDVRKSKRLRVTSNKDGVTSYILIDDDDDTPTVSVSPEFSSYASVPQPTKRSILDDDVAFVYEIRQGKHPSGTINEASLPVLGSQVDPCFSAGLLLSKRNKKAFGNIVQKGSELGF